MWEKYVTRRVATQVAQAWNLGFGQAMKKVYGISVNDTLVFKDAKKTDYYVNKKQHQKYVTDLYKLLENDKFIKNFHKNAQTKLENILKNTTKKLNGDLTKLPNKELLEIYKNFVLPNVAQFYIRMWTVFNIGEPLAITVHDKLKKIIKQKSGANDYLLKLSSPLEPNDVLNERKDLLKITLLKNKLNRKELEIKIKNHTKKYRHIPMFDFDHDPYNELHFTKELKSINNPEKELAELKKLFINRKKDFMKILKEIKPNQKFKKLLEFLKENVYLRDYRDMIRQKLNLELKKLYTEIGKRLDLDIKQVAILTDSEIIYYLKNNIKFPKKEIKQREKSYLLIQKGSQVKIYSGKKAEKKFNQELKIEKVKKVNIIKGIIGSKGKAKGKAKIIYTNKDLYKVKQGDVLVATMTRQDFVPAMRRSSALITDEGGVTCHAAIIARELNIPCIVATKIATQVLKDKDEVEVDADKGVVTILKRK